MRDEKGRFVKGGHYNPKRNNWITISCPCGKLIKRRFSRIKRGREKYCSKACSYKYKKMIAWNKGRKGLQVAWNKGKKCPQLGGKSHHWWQGGITYIEKECKYCFGHFKPRRIVVENGYGKFCSRRCHGRWRSENLIKERSINWKGGITPENQKIRTSKRYIKWRELVYKRDNYTCQICGDNKGGNLHANHIKKFSDFNDLRFIVNNGITLCKDCHVKIVTFHEEEWENYFNFNLLTREVL